MKITSRINDVTGRHNLKWDRSVPVSSPLLVPAILDYVRSSDIRSALVVVNKEAAQDLSKHPGFHIAREDFDYRLSWPSKVNVTYQGSYRQAQSNDSELISQIINDSFGLPFGTIAPPGWVREDCFASNWHNIILSDASGPTAFGSVIHDGEEGNLNWICVLPKAKGQGLGKQLLTLLLAELDSQPHKFILLTVTDVNLRAIRMYENFGFVRTEGPYVHVEYERVVTQ